jgi:hypothetical protein
MCSLAEDQYPESEHSPSTDARKVKLSKFWYSESEFRGKNSKMDVLIQL